MADHTKIEWTDATWNIITGCSVVSAGCKHCYAMKLAGTRLKHDPSRAGLTIDTQAGPVWTGEVRFNNQWLEQPMRWKRPRRIFVCAHGDLFHEAVPLQWISAVFAIMAACPQHTFQVLTKRPERMKLWFDVVGPLNNAQGHLHESLKGWMGYSNPARPAINLSAWPLPNVWLGVSVEDQAAADERIPLLLQCPAAVRWISAEPLLGPVDLTIDGLVCLPCRNAEYMRMDPTTGAYECCGQCDFTGIGDEWGIDWVVAGGESGPGARPMHPDWARSLRDQCAAAGVPFLFKQWGEWAPSRQCMPFTATERDKFDVALGPGREHFMRIGKKRAGRTLDGRLHDEFPEVRNA